MRNLLLLGLLVSLSLTTTAKESQITNFTVEELRIENAQKEMPQVFQLLGNNTKQFTEQVSQAKNLTTLTQLVIRHGQKLWQDAVIAFKNQENYDDRALYWARLQMTKELRQNKTFQGLLALQQQQLLWKFELISRGQLDIKFDRGSKKKILVTGFDPFFLDRNIGQSNPSGVAALALDNLVVNHLGQSAEIESLIIPVRFADFDQGMIEELLTPYFRQVDMIVTISMGRENFDLERFPSLRRSANAPDNLNVYTGGTKELPVLPLLFESAFVGPEFVEFSLPVAAMQKAKGPFTVNDNRKVTTLEGIKIADSLQALTTQTSVEGSGGGYLSNEISYRSIVLRDAHKPTLPVGHIHTPRIKGFEPERTREIVKQIKQMLTLTISDI
ncbi:hypothetical protein [Thalassotalea marina]|uniref:Pyrrolidone-carboxylate peptidase n=1 Tax=Thalassotalea marina TaxID=1673741 RepID=A0A919EKR0_9GAMM|nr:hypothetical protein [Thalassotalea marina]GHF92962.1 hypothetical protein GCM10017161_21470 [Thalassotalea marina]